MEMKCQEQGLKGINKCMDRSRKKIAKIKLLKAEYDKREVLKYSHPIGH